MTRLPAQKSKSFVGGAALLAVAGLLGKVVAAFYRVWLNALIGPVGLGIYTIPSSFYAFLLVISTAGIPTAISKLVSESLAKNDERGAKEVFNVAVRFLLATGAFATVLMASLSGVLATAAGQPEAAPGFIALSPSLAVVCLLSAYRGYFQGRQNMLPSAVSQIVEQIGRLVFGFGLAVLWSPKGPAAAAAGAVLGVTLCEVSALAVILGSYGRHRRISREHFSEPVKPRFKPVAARILKIAVPVTLGACVMPLVSLTDTMTVINRLMSTGIEREAATGMFGILNGMVQSIINMPAVITLSLSVSLVPAISEALSSGDSAHATNTSRMGVKIAILIGLPCAIGLFLLADPILKLLSPSYTLSEHNLAVSLLRILSVAVFFLSVTQTTTGILQGCGKPILPVLSLGIGALVKTVLNYFLIVSPAVGIAGAAIGSVACYAIASVINLINVVKIGRMSFTPTDLLIKPAIAALGMGVAVWAGWRYLPQILGYLPALAACVGAGVLLYGVLAFAMGLIDRKDIERLQKRSN